MSLADGLPVLPVGLFLLLHFTNDVLAIDESLKATHWYVCVCGGGGGGGGGGLQLNQ